MPATVMLPELNRSSPSWTTFSPTAWVMLLGLICSVPDRWSLTLSSPAVALSISSVSSLAPREVAKFGAD
jgi:hypothetical protein